MSDAASSVAADVLAEVAAGGAADAGGLPVDLLGDFLPALVGAVVAQQTLTRRQMTTYQAIGDGAARQGVALRALLDLYLSAAWRLWRHLPAVIGSQNDPDAVVAAGEIMLHAVDDAVAALTEGYQLARRSLVRIEESSRREFIDDLLTGGADVAGVLQRTARYGLDLSGPHATAVVTADHPFADGSPIIGRIERAIQGRKGDAGALVASKQDRLVLVFPAPDGAAVNEVIAALSAVLGARTEASNGRRRRTGLGAWQIGVGRAGAGVRGVVASYRESLEVLELAARLSLTDAVVHSRQLLVYRVLLRDRPAITELVESSFTPLLGARGGAGPLLDTLAAYFAAGTNTAQTARALHLSVRAVTYRLERVRQLTGLDPALPSDQFSLHVAVLGARLLNWPVDAEVPAAH